MRKLFSAILATVLLVAALPLQVFAANASGGVIPTIAFGETVSVTREKHDEVNLFLFEVPASGPVELRFIGDLGSVSIFITDADEKTAWSESALFNNVTERLSIVETIHLTAGTYQIKIGTGYSYGKGNYSLTLSHTAITESFPESHTSNQNTLATAKTIAFNQAYTGYLASNDDKNFYQFTLAQADKVTVYLDAAGRSLRLYIYDENGKSVLDTGTNAVTGSKSKDLPAGTYYLCITDIMTSHGTYDFSISAPSVPVTTPAPTPTPPVTTTPPSSTEFIDTVGHWANEYIRKAFENGLVNGIGNGKYNPDANVSNAEWSQMTANLLWAEEYRVTTPDAPWWYNAARWNFQMGFLNGTVLADSYTKTTDIFPAAAVNTAINRYDMAQVIYNIAMSDAEVITVGTVNTSGMSDKIADYRNIPAKYRTAVEYCYAAGFITGTDSKGTFDGNASMTRAAAATVLCRLLDAKNGVWVMPLSLANTTQDSLIYETGVFILSDDGLSYTYNLPEQAPDYNYYDKAFSSSHGFRDMFIEQYGSSKAVVYDMLAAVTTQLFYDDSIDFKKEVTILGFDKIATVTELSSASLSVEKDMPLLNSFIFTQINGSTSSYTCKLSREVINYFSDQSPSDNSSYITMRDNVVSELTKYRFAVTGVTDDVEKLEIAGKMFNDGAFYDSNAPYHGIHALLNKRGICGSSNWAFAIIGNALGVPTYWLAVSNANHAVTLVKPNNGELKIMDATFSYSGSNNPKVTNVSNWRYASAMVWTPDVLGFLYEYYFPDVDVFEHLGGLSK